MGISKSALRLKRKFTMCFFKNLGQDLRPKEIKPSIVNKQCVVYHFSCDLCDADYVGYTARHLHQRIAEHKNSVIGRHFLEAHGNNNLLRENQFTVLRKCQSKPRTLSDN